MLKLLSFWLLILGFNVFAIEPPPEAEAEYGDGSAIVDKDVLELDTMTVKGERLSLQKETRLRVVRQALNEPRSSKKEDKDKLLCWLETPVGTHFQHVTCARNGDLDALRLGGKDGQLGGSAGYGRHKFWRSIQADNQATLRNILADLPDNGYFDQDFVSIASSGGQPPRDAPDIEELTQFAKAWIEVESLTTAVRPENEVVDAIVDEGLTLKRYNRLVALTQSYQTIRVKVTELVIELQSPDE